MENRFILRIIHTQIKDTIDQYPYLKIDDIKVYIQEENICFQVRDFIYKENMVDFLTAYVNETKADETTAISLNTAVLLDEMNDVVKNSEHIN